MGTITIVNLGKAYRQYPNRWARLWEWLWPGRNAVHKLKWVLKDVSFRVNAGEAVGIIGINGAGKSTLLKIITGTTQPTTGSVCLNGSVAALLELGMGFHPDFTGRQNALMAGQLLGYSRATISALMPEIEEFADIGDYIDQPVRIYSSGMQVRLAFSVATAIRPDILIVDEALSVGDAFFQHKCIQRIRGFREKGTTLLFVSHSPDTIRMLCQRAIMLANGTIAKIGDVATVMDFYRASQVLKLDTAEQELAITETALEFGAREKKYVLASRTVGSVTVNITGDSHYIETGGQMSICITAIVNQACADPHVGFGIRNKMGTMIYEANTYTLKHPTRPVSEGEKLSVTFSFICLLASDTYELVVGVANGGYGTGSFEQTLFFDQSFLVFEVTSSGDHRWSGLCDLQPAIEVG